MTRKVNGMGGILAAGIALALASTVSGGEIKALKPGSSINPADYDVGELREFVRGGGVLFCSDALYRSTWQLLGQVDADFGKVTWRPCESWAKDGDSQTRPVGKPPHPLMTFPNAYDDADTWGHFVGSSCKGWTVLAACAEGEPMMLYRQLGKGGVIACANLWWYGAVPKVLTENINAWTGLLGAGIVPASAQMTPVAAGRGRVSITLAKPPAKESRLAMTVEQGGGRKSVFAKKFSAKGVELDYELAFAGGGRIELAVESGREKSRTVILARDVNLPKKTVKSGRPVTPKVGKTGLSADADGIFHWNGKPFFPLGVYHVEPKDFEKVKDIGFNFVQAFKYKMVLGKGIAKAERLKLPVLVEGDYRDIPLRALDMFQKSPSTAMWYVADEPSEHSRRLVEASAAYRAWDKNRLTFVASNRPDLFGWLSGFADVFACDCYGDMGKCVDWLRRVDRQLPSGRPFVFVPPAVPKDIRYLRAQAFLGIAHGARGLLWYAWEDEDRPDVALCDRDGQIGEFRKLLSELAANADCLTSPSRDPFETGTIHGVVLGEKSGRRAFVVNVSSKTAAKASVRLPDGAVVPVQLGPLEAKVVNLAVRLVP